MCLGKHSCMSSPFPIAILNGTFFFRSVKAMNNWDRSAIKQILLLLLIKYFHIMFIIVVFWLGCDRPSGHLFFVTLSSYLLRLFLYLISFLLFPGAVFGKTLVHEFPISYSHTECYTFFFQSVKAMNNWKRSAIKQILLTN